MNQKIKQPAHECGYTPAANLQPEISKCRAIYIFSKFHCSDVEKILSSLSRNKGSGLDKIPTRVIKHSVPVIIPSITAIRNSPATTSTCILEVSPLLKEGDFEEPGNNRPISLLPILSKVCEKQCMTSADCRLQTADCRLQTADH